MHAVGAVAGSVVHISVHRRHHCPQLVRDRACCAIAPAMAKFGVPSQAQKPLGQYDVKAGSLWRIRINEGQHGRVFVSEGTDLKISSNNSQVVPNDESVFNITDTHGRSGVLNFFGLSAGVAMLEARDTAGNVVAYIQLDVASIGGKHAYFELEQPSMALNASDSPVRYQMKYSLKVTPAMSVREIIAAVVAKSQLRHLTISCHGYGDPSLGPFLVLGQGFRTMEDASAFSPLYNVLKGGVIWIGACAVCGGDQGVEFSKVVAKAAGCYVVAPGMTIAAMPVHLNQIEVFTRSFPHYLSPRGELMKQSGFLRLDRKLGFKMISVK